MKLLRKYPEKFEQWGLDEAFLDVSNNVQNFKEAKILAEKIKKRRLRWTASDSAQVVGYKLYWSENGEVNYDSKCVTLIII